MALPATLVWEKRATDGTADGGGSFDPSVASPGTDYSQQNAVQIAFTDLVVGTPNTTVTSVANPFTSAHVGNTIAITTTGGGAAWTIDFYNIRSVAVGVATLDKSPAATASTAGVGNLGGARNGFTTGTSTMQAKLVAGNVVHVKGSGQAWNEAVVLSVAGAAGNPIQVIGYNAARNDKPTDSTRPLNNRASAAGDGIIISGGAYILRYLMVTAAGDAGFSVVTTAKTRLEYCKSYSNTGEGFEQTQATTNIGCEANNNGVGGFAVGSSSALHGCYSHDNTGTGFGFGTNTNNCLTFCISETNTSHGFGSVGDRTTVLNCTSNGNTGASTDGITYVTPTGDTFLANNILSNNGRYGAGATDGDSLFADFNDYFGNATAARNNVPVGANDSTLDPTFTDAANGNFAIGTNLKALGFPGIFPGALSQGYLSLGAVQPNPTGGGGMLRHPGMEGGCNA